MDPRARTRTPSLGRLPGGMKTASPEGIAVAFDALYRAFYVRLVRRATWKFRLSKEDASEVAQDAFIVALDKLDIEGDPTAWLYRAVRDLQSHFKEPQS